MTDDSKPTQRRVRARRTGEKSSSAAEDGAVDGAHDPIDVEIHGDAQAPATTDDDVLAGVDPRVAPDRLVRDAAVLAVAGRRVGVRDSAVLVLAAGEVEARDTLIVLGAVGAVGGDARVILDVRSALALGVAFGVTLAAFLRLLRGPGAA